MENGGILNGVATFDVARSVQFAADHAGLPIVIVAGYIVGCVVHNCCLGLGRPAPPRWTQQWLAAWNASLSFFSFAGALHTVSALLRHINTSETLADTISTPPLESWGVGKTGWWVALFVASKVVELGDTAWIVTRGRPITFLHSYHHASVLLYVWHSYATMAPQTLYFVAMNYSVHAAMYGYYCLSVLKRKPAWMKARIITAAQILQMAFGVSVQCGGGFPALGHVSRGVHWN